MHVQDICTHKAIGRHRLVISIRLAVRSPDEESWLDRTLLDGGSFGISFDQRKMGWFSHIVADGGGSWRGRILVAMLNSTIDFDGSVQMVPHEVL